MIKWLNFYSVQVLLSAVCCFGIFLTIHAAGWFLLILGILFVLSFFLQVIFIWRSVWFMTKLKTQVYLTTAMFFLLAVFREDFNSGHKSSIGTLSVISHWLGFRPDAYYKEISDFGFLVNLIWVIFFVGQILCLVKLKKLKSKKIN